MICLYLYQYLSLWDASYIVGNELMCTSQCKFNRVNPFSCSWDISRWSFYSYWWPDISVICCCFCTSRTCADSSHSGLSRATWFVKIGPLVVEIQAEWSLWQRQMKKQVHLNLKQRKGNHAHIHSNVWTVGVTTKPTQICVHSRGIDSIRSGNKRSMPRSVKTGSSWFTLWGAANLNNDHTKPQNLLEKYPKELIHCQYYSWDLKPIQCHLHPRTFLVWNLQNPQLIKLQRQSSNRNNTSSKLAVVCQNSFR